MAVQQDIDVFNGEDILLSVSPASGVTPTDITGWTLSFTLLTGLGGTVVFTKTSGSGISVTSAAAGTFTVTLTATNTDQTPGTYYYFLRRTDSGNVAVLTAGRLKIKPSE